MEYFPDSLDGLDCLFGVEVKERVQQYKRDGDEDYGQHSALSSSVAGPIVFDCGGKDV